MRLVARPVMSYSSETAHCTGQARPVYSRDHLNDVPAQKVRVRAHSIGPDRVWH